MFTQITEHEYTCRLPKSCHSQKIIQAAKNSDVQTDESISLWDDDHISPASEIDSFNKSNDTVLFTKDATFRRVSAFDLEIELHIDNSILLVKGDAQVKFFYLINRNNTETGIMKMFTDQTAPIRYRSGSDEIEMTEIV